MSKPNSESKSTIYSTVIVVDTLPSVVLMANLPSLENITEYEGSAQKYNVCKCFHICYVMILMIERNIAWFCPSPFKYECNNSKKCLYNN